MLKTQHPKITAVIAFLCVLFCSRAECASVLTATSVQSGIKVSNSTPRIVKVGTFTFGTGQSSFSAVQLRAWIDLAGTSTVPNAPGVFNSPTLVFTKYSASNDYSGSSPLVTDLQISNFGSSTRGVDEQMTSWISLSSAQGLQLASLINSDPLGRIDAYLISSVNKDFDLPRSTTRFKYLGPGNFQFSTTTYTSTIGLIAVPEPSTLCATGLALLAGGRYLIRRRRK